MQIKNISVDALKYYKNNPRKNDNAVDNVAASIKEFGFKVPIVVDSNCEIVAGHTRYKAAKKLGLQEVPCIVADDLTPDQIKAFRLADNKVAEFAEWDLELLEVEMSDIDLDLTSFGFEDLAGKQDKPIINNKPVLAFNKIQYLITCNIDMHDKIVDLITELKQIEGVEVHGTLDKD